MMLLSASVMAQVGDKFTPMQYSTHTYSVEMDEETNTPVWKIYKNHITANDVESGNFEADLQTRNSDYLVLSDDIESGVAIIKIQYNGNMEPGNYTIAYRETNNDFCYKTLVKTITMQGPFDVDVELNNVSDADDCPDLSDEFKDPDADDYQTTIAYKISLVNPDPDTDDGYSGSSWSFNYDVEIEGRVAGQNSSIATVLVEYAGYSNEITVTGNPSVYDNSLTVDNDPQVDEVIISVTYNDQLGVTQDVLFEISEIEGAYTEFDIDPFERVTNIIYGMPDVGDITAIN
jgi:hypothetical protein